MVIYVCPTQKGFWVKANEENRRSLNTLKIWWTQNSNMDLDYVDRSLTLDRRKPTYAIRSVSSNPQKAIEKFTKDILRLSKSDPVDVLEITASKLLDLTSESEE